MEGFLFSRLLRFSRAEVVLTMTLYSVLYAAVVASLFRSTPDDQSAYRESAYWRNLSTAPMAVIVIGSFVSLPLLLVIVAVAKLGSF